MSQIQPAGGRLLQSLQSRISPSTQNLFAGTPLVVSPQHASSSQVDQQDQATIEPPAEQGSKTVSANPSEDLDAAQKLAIFEEVLQQVETGAVPPEMISNSAYAPQQAVVSALDPTAVYTPSEDSGLFAQAIPAAVDQAQAQLQQQMPISVGGKKEHLEGASLGVSASELPIDIQYVEEEKSAELPPEVESYIEHVQEAAQTQPERIVIAEEPSVASSSAPTPPRIVRVLPLTRAQEEMGLKKGTAFSIRWLVEFGHKIAKALVGQVVYREN